MEILTLEEYKKKKSQNQMQGINSISLAEYREKNKKTNINDKETAETSSSNINLPNTSAQAKTTIISLPINKNVSNLPIVKDLNKTKTSQENNLPILPVNTQPQQTSRTVTDVAKEFLDTTGNSAKTVLNAGINLARGVASVPEDIIDDSLQFASSKYNPVMQVTADDLSTKDKVLNIIKAGLVGAKNLTSALNIFNPTSIATAKTNSIITKNIENSMKESSSIKSKQNIAQELIQKDVTNDLIDEKLGYNKTLNTGKTVKETIEDGSLIKQDNFGGQIFQSVGQMLPSMMLGQATAGGEAVKEAVSLGTMALSSAASGLETAYSNGASREKATQYALLNAAVETVSEKMFAGIGGVFGTGAIDDVLKKEIQSKIKNKVVQKITEFGLDAAGEGFEELASDIMQPIVQKLTYLKEADLKKLYSEQNYLEDFVSGALSSVILQGISLPTTISSINNKNKVNVPPVNNPETNLPTIAKQEDINYNTIEGDMNDKRTRTSNTNEDGQNDRRGMGELQTNEGISNILQTSNERNNSNQKGTTIEQDYGTVEERREYFERVKNNVPKTFTTEQIELQNEIKELGIDLKYFVGENNGSLIGTTDNGTIYLDVNKNNSINEDSDLKQRFYHELFHNIKRNNDLNLKNEIDELKQFVIDNDFISINNYIENRGYDSSLFSNSQKIKSRFAEEVLADYSAKHLAGYNIDYNLSQETEYRLNTLLDDAISTMKLNTKNKQKNIPIVKENKINLPPVQTTNEVVENDTKIMNPNEISKLSIEDAITTPNLPLTNRNNTLATEQSSFYKNATKTSEFLTEESRNILSGQNDIKYYEGITNKETLSKAKERLDNGGALETFNWFDRNKMDSNRKMKHNPTAVDVAEGWILMKQYQDAGDYNSMVEVAKTMREIGTQAGQTVQAFNIMERLTPEGMVKYAQSELSEAFENMSKNKTKQWIDSNREAFDLTPQEVQFIIDTMNEVQQMEDGYDKRVKLSEIQKMMTDKLPPSKGAGIKAWMRISMLFNPKTQVRNVLGNAVIAPVNTFSDLFASGVDRIISKKTGVRTTGITDIKNYLKGFKKGAYESYNDFKKGINTRNIEGNRFEVSEGRSFNNNTVMGKALNRVDNLLGFMLDAGDRTFYEATFTNSINNQLILNNTDVVTQEMIDIATQEALSRTWQDNNNYTKFVLNIRKGLNMIHIPGINGYGLGDVLIPFAKTPANLTKAIVDYSPAGLIKTINEGINLKRSLTNGQYTAKMQHDFVQDLGKATAGTMLYVLGYALAKAGITSGESDDDKDVANFMKNALGVSSYSIKIGDKTFTYDWAQPIATPFAIMANYVQNKKENASLQENITSILDTGLNVLFEQSFLESMSDILSESGEIGTKLEEQILELPSRAVPTLMKQIADMTDGTQRTTFEKDKPLETAKNKVLAKIPFASTTLAPSVDTMGREIQKYGGKNNLFNVFLNPANVNTENISEAAAEIYKVYQATGETSVMPRVPEYSYKDKDGNTIIITSEQRTEYQKVSGKIIEDEINRLLEMNEYKNMNNTEKAEVLNDIVNYSYNIAKNKILGLDISQTYQKAYDYSQIGNVSDYYTFKNSIDTSNSDSKKESVSNYLISSKLNDEQLAFLYGTYYSSEKTLNNIVNSQISMKEFIKYNSQTFETKYASNGKAITNSRKSSVINYVNSLNLTVPQKAILIKMEYASYDKYDKQIVEYINNKKLSIIDKGTILKSIGINSFDKQLINYVNSKKLTVKEKTKILQELGFTVRNGKVIS